MKFFRNKKVSNILDSLLLLNSYQKLLKLKFSSKLRNGWKISSLKIISLILIEILLIELINC